MASSVTPNLLPWMALAKRIDRPCLAGKNVVRSKRRNFANQSREHLLNEIDWPVHQCSRIVGKLASNPFTIAPISGFHHKWTRLLPSSFGIPTFHHTAFSIFLRDSE
ncbi:uncharacterized protein LOC118457931 [Anopheles albimanus]|uniref:uncharacterized protein LOC118457931 n=1 Tax=Anopheles albimanus TaxID=7167 RepID=UPI001640687F|nr:uncharacterized protein LOC118457931 [Anopheles albimanus]